MTRLLLVRHGTSEYNSIRRFAGHSDIDLTPLGYKQAEKLRDRLAGEKIDIIYCSDLKRAAMTASIISSRHQVETVVCPELRELNYGDIEGLSYEEIKSRYPETAELIATRDITLNFPNGESINDLITREHRFLERLSREAPAQNILIVAHSGPLQMLVCHLIGIEHRHWWQIRFDNASLSIIDTYPPGAIITVLNDTSHLKDIDKNA
ncbi:MAG: histidine phosphatase family protein [Chloroflexota bacterium]